MIDYSWHRRALDSIASGYLTNSKRPSCHVQGVYPTHLRRGRGCKVWDTTGKEYLDFICGLGTNLLGYAHERVNSAVANQMTMGASLSFASTIEVETAEKLKEMFPFIDAVRFLKTGTEACAAAVRIARAKTGKNLVYSAGYHGWSDGFVSLTPPAIGVGEGAGHDFANLVDLEFEKMLANAAAVIIEPVITDHSRARIEWLKRLREICTKLGVMLIFDEVITGFRFPKYSVSALYGIEPDLICLGKAIANGMPLAVVGGKYPVMNCGEYFVSSTYAGESLSLAAAKETMTLLQTKYSMDDLWLHGQHFIDEFNKIWPEGVTLLGYPSRGIFMGNQINKALFFQEACRGGVLFGPSWFFNFPMIEEYKNVLGLCKDILTRVKNSEVQLLGELPKSPFAEKVRMNA